MVAIASGLEEKLVKACTEGDLELCRSSVVDLQTRYSVSAEPVQELLGYASSCAAANNYIEILELLLYPTDSTPTMVLAKEVHECLLYGMCRWEKYFPRRPRFQCCYALRYLAYAAVVSVEQNAFQAMEFLTRPQEPPRPSLLMDTDVVRCFCCALELGSGFHAPAPEAYRPVLMMLLYRYPTLLLPHLEEKRTVEDSNANKHMDALRSSLMYEYVTNPQLQTQAQKNTEEEKL